MKKIGCLLCIICVSATYSFAQNTPAQTQAAPAAPAAPRQFVQTPEQKAAADKLAADRLIDYNNMLVQLKLTLPLRQKPVSGYGLPNSANYDEAKANSYPIPDPLTLKNGKKVATAKDWWGKRRPEIVEDMDRELYGRVPKNLLKVTWSVASVSNDTVGGVVVITKKLIGHVDNSSYPNISVDIDLTLSTPANAKGPVPVMMVLSGGSFILARRAP